LVNKGKSLEEIFMITHASQEDVSENHELAAQKPVVSYREMMRLRDLVTLYDFDSMQMQLISTSIDERKHVQEAIAKGQDDFLVAILPQGNHAKLVEAVEILHRLRGKPPASKEKLEGLAEKGYMLIKESELTEPMLKALRPCFAEQKEASMKL